MYFFFSHFIKKEYLPATVTGYDAETQQHQLQLPSEELRLDVSKADVRLVQPPATDTTEPPSSPTKAGRTARAATRTDAQTPVHTGTAHTANTNTLTERSAPVHTGTAHTANFNTLIECSTLTPPKGRGKRSLFSANDLPSPTTATRKTQNKTAKKAPATNDALPPAFEDPAAPSPLLQCGFVA